MICHFSRAFRLALGSNQLPIQWYRGVSPRRVKRSGRKADGSLPSSAEVKNERNYTSTPDITSWGMQDDTIQLYFYSMHCVLVLWLHPAVILNNKMKSVTETETGKCDRMPYVSLQF